MFTRRTCPFSRSTSILSIALFKILNTGGPFDATWVLLGSMSNELFVSVIESVSPSESLELLDSLDCDDDELDSTVFLGSKLL